MKHTDREACERARSLASSVACALRRRLRQSGFPAARARGFTLIELMVVVGIVAIMLAIAVPSFRSITLSNRISSEVNTFVGDLQFARSEAIRRGAFVSMCPSSNGTACLTTNTWHSGWIVFSDVNGTGTVNTDDTVMRIQRTWVGTDTMVASPDSTAVTYNRDGFAATATVTFILHTSPADDKTTKCVALNTVGRQTVQKVGTGSCT